MPSNDNYRPSTPSATYYRSASQDRQHPNTPRYRSPSLERDGRNHHHQHQHQHQHHQHHYRHEHHRHSASPHNLVDPVLGDFVSRQLVPEMLDASDRPLALVMNFGTLVVDDPATVGQVVGRGHANAHGHGNRRVVGKMGDGGNAVIYNAPQSTMFLGPTAAKVGTGIGLGSGGVRGVGVDGGWGMGLGMGPGLAPGAFDGFLDEGFGIAPGGGVGRLGLPPRRIGLCPGCLNRQLISVISGVCLQCEVSENLRTTDGPTSRRVGSCSVCHVRQLVSVNGMCRECEISEWLRMMDGLGRRRGGVGVGRRGEDDGLASRFERLRSFGGRAWSTDSSG